MKTFFVITAALAIAGCGKKPEAQGEPPPTAVETITLEVKPIESSNEYLATLVSRRAVTLYPQISGYVRSIEVKPGAQVKARATLLQIDASADQASLQNLVATRESLVSSSSFAKQRLQRATALRKDGIVSQQDADQAHVQAEQAEASLRATDALISSQKAKIGFFQILAPFDGVVGNVPVKVGDFVAPTTELTSVTQEAGLEAEVFVPVERTAQVTPESKIRLVDSEGKTLAESPVVFVSPKTDAMTQMVLLKAAFQAMPNLRAEQLVRARIIWSVEEGLTIPTVSVLRQAGKTFVYVVEGGKAKRVVVTLGPVQGGQYVVTEGLKAGQQVVTSGVQHVMDGASVTASAGKSS